jgi:hypothetical protein
LSVEEKVNMSKEKLKKKYVNRLKLILNMAIRPKNKMQATESLAVPEEIQLRDC